MRSDEYRVYPSDDGRRAGENWPRPTGDLWIERSRSSGVAAIAERSRYLIALHATGCTRAEPVREQLEQAFEVCGVPEGRLIDHGTPWWNTQAPSGNASLALALWLMRQGIGLHWSRIRHPQTQGKVERFHGSLERALDNCGTPQNTQAWLDAYR